MVCGKNVGGSSRSGRIATIRHRMVTVGDCLLVRDCLRKYSWRCYGVWWKCRRIVPIRTDRNDPSQAWRMVTIHDSLQWDWRYSWRCYGVWWKFRRIIPIGTNCDDPSQALLMVTFRDSLQCDLENIHGGKNVGGSSRLGRTATINPSQAWRMVTIHDSLQWDLQWVLWCVVKMSADRPDWDGSWRSITSVTDGDVSRLLAVRERLRKYSWRCYVVWWKYRRIVTTRHNCDG